MDLVQRLKLNGNISVASTRRSAKFGRNRSSRAGDIEDFNKSKRRLCRHFGSSSNVKTHRNISIGSMRRHAKFGRVPSSRAGDIIGFSKSKITAQAAILDLVQRLKLIGNISVASMRRSAKIW